MKVVLALLVVLVAALVAVATASTSFHLARDLREASHAQPASFIVHLRDQLDAASLVKQVRVSSQLTRAALGALVVESALALSLRTQPLIIAWLRAQPAVVDVRPLFIANCIVVDVGQGAAELVDALEQRFPTQIAHLEPNRAFSVNLRDKRAEELAAGEGVLPRQQPLTFQGGEEEQNTFMDVDATLPPTQWNIDYVQAPAVWNSTGRGEGLIYANADTGVFWEHESLRDNYLGARKGDDDEATTVAAAASTTSTVVDHNYAWWDGVRRALRPGVGPCGIAASVPCDDHGHGTHTTSTTVGSHGIGVAPGARWMACRNMERGFGSSETYLSCLQFFLAPTDLEGKNPVPSMRPHAIGNSYGCPSEEGCAWNAFSQAVKTLRAAGIFMSVSAGNEGPQCSTVGAPPGYEKAVITVGSTQRDGRISSFSSRGPVVLPEDREDGDAASAGYRKPDVTAPGSGVTAAYPHSTRDNAYISLSGTSMASPHVGGAALLIMQACPALLRNVDAVQALLQETAHGETSASTGTRACGGDADDLSPNNVYGYGGIDIWAAVERCREAETGAEASGAA